MTRATAASSATASSTAASSAIARSAVVRSVAVGSLAAVALAVVAAPALALNHPAVVDGEDDAHVEVSVNIPETVGGVFDVDDARLRWGLNAESGSGAFFGGCNFLVAGKSGDAGGSRVWNQSDTNLFSATDGNVRIELPANAGQTSWRTLTWDNKCQNYEGQAVRAVPGDYGTGITAVIDAGTGEIDLDEHTARIEWEGSVTVAFYGGMTYWWFEDPVLTVDSDGTGQLTATLGGFGADMDDASRWLELDEWGNVELATLSDVSITRQGIVHVPDYEGVEVAASGGRLPQVRTGGAWGAFPERFIDFQIHTGQSAYWYTSGGARDFAKPASTMWISFDASAEIDTDPGTNPDGTDGSAPSPNLPSFDGTGSGAGTTPVQPPGPGTLAPGGGATDATGSQGPQFLMAPIDWLAAVTGGLIPDAVVGANHGERVAWAGAAVLALASLGAVGVRMKWLVLPWT